MSNKDYNAMIECKLLNKKIYPAYCYRVRAVVCMRFAIPSTIEDKIENLDDAAVICNSCQYVDGSALK